MRLFVSFRAQRSGVEKSGFRLNLLFVRSQISPLQAAPRPSGRDDRGADFNHNWYNILTYGVSSFGRPSYREEDFLTLICFSTAHSTGCQSLSLSSKTHRKIYALWGRRTPLIPQVKGRNKYVPRFPSYYPIKYRDKLSKRFYAIILLTPLFPSFSLGYHTALAIIVIISGKIAQ